MQTDIIIYFMKLYAIEIFSFYSFKKISNHKKIKNSTIYLMVVSSFFLSILCTYIKFYISSFSSVIVLCFSYGSILGIITKNELGYSLIITIISYAISLICFGISAAIGYIPYKFLNIDSYYLNLFIILIIHFLLECNFFRIKKFKNGFDFLNKKLNNNFADIIIIYFSVIVVILYCLFGTLMDKMEEIRINMLITIMILASTMFIMIQKTFTIYYKQKLMEDTLGEYKKEIKEKDEEIKKLKDEKFNISRITHEFYNRQKAMELLIKENMNDKNDISKENASENVLNIIKSLTEEYSEELTNIKQLSKLEKTEIPEIDAMFKYMQSECIKSNIEFKLKVIGNIYPLINNIIHKNKLETLIGDHLRDAIRAVNSADSQNKEIFAILGIKDNKYELSIFDTGVEFKVETLLKLGLEPVTTYANKGGTGIGFLTTFETLKETKASLIIKELLPEKENFYTKSITIRFDGKNQYKICSYRVDEIKKYNNSNNRIIIENL